MHTHNNEFWVRLQRLIQLVNKDKYTISLSQYFARIIPECREEKKKPYLTYYRCLDQKDNLSGISLVNYLIITFRVVGSWESKHALCKKLPVCFECDYEEIKFVSYFNCKRTTCKDFNDTLVINESDVKQQNKLSIGHYPFSNKPGNNTIHTT